MELKKDYFPTTKAPDIAKKKVMQYIYGKKESLSKRFYFYRVYAPAFLLLFIVMGGISFYNKELKPIDRLQNGIMPNEYANKKPDLIEKTEDVGSFVENKNIESKNDILTSDASIDNINVEKPMIKSVPNDTNTEGTTIVQNDMILRKDNVSTPTSATSLASSNEGLQQQISDIENLMNDIASITKEEEQLF